MRRSCAALHFLALPVLVASLAHPSRPFSLRSASPHGRRATAPCCCASPEQRFREWMEAERPGQSVARLPIVTSSATTPEGALRDVWRAVMASSDASSPSVAVLLLPDVDWLGPWERMLALDKHMRSCRDCATHLGASIRLQALHPDAQVSSPTDSQIEVDRRRAPLPAFTLSRRVGPTQLRPPGPEEEGNVEVDAPTVGVAEATTQSEAAADEESLRAAREQLERQFREAVTDGIGGGGAGAAGGGDEGEAEPADPEAVLDETMEWFSSYFGRVHKLFGHRQRRLVLRGQTAEAVYAAFWGEAARLCGDDDPPPSAAAEEEPAVMQAPAEPLSSLLVLSGDVAEADAYRNVRQTLALSLALLGMADSFTLSAFHPRDTFELRTADDGKRAWEETLPHPLIHLVLKRKPVAK